jgi:hypothetical protein
MNVDKYNDLGQLSLDDLIDERDRVTRELDSGMFDDEHNIMLMDYLQAVLEWIHLKENA